MGNKGSTVDFKFNDVGDYIAGTFLGTRNVDTKFGKRVKAIVSANDLKGATEIDGSATDVVEGHEVEMWCTPSLAAIVLGKGIGMPILFESGSPRPDREA